MFINLYNLEISSPNIVAFGLLLFPLFFRGPFRGLRSMIKEIGINTRFYPKHYVKTKSWERRLFKIDNCDIPGFIYYSFWLFTIIIALGTTFSLVLIVMYKFDFIKATEDITACNIIWVGFVMLCIALYMLDGVLQMILSSMYKRK